MGHRAIRVGRVEKTPSLKQQAYESIKRLVLHELSDGQSLLVDELATQLGTSRTPVREALLLLEQEGLVNCVPYKGTFVAEPSADEVKQIYQVREIIETFGVRLATPRISDPELKQLRARFDAVQEAMEDGDFEPYFHSDTEFHDLIIRNAGNDILKEIIENLSHRVFHIRARARRRSSVHLRQSFQEHCLILEALIERDVSRAERLMREHIRNAGERIASIMT